MHRRMRGRLLLLVALFCLMAAGNRGVAASPARALLALPTSCPLGQTLCTLGGVPRCVDLQVSQH